MIYRDAAKYLDDGAGTLRNRIYNANASKQNVKQLKQLYALVSETLKHKTALQYIINASQMMKVERKLNMNIAMVMVYDLLIGVGRLNCSKCAEKDAIIRHKTRLNAELVKYKLKNPVIVDKQDNDEPPVRWIRVNLGRMPGDSPKAMFERLGLTEVNSWANVKAKNYYKDKYVANLYAIPPSISMAKLPEYANGSIIVQDRASCFPVTIMNPAMGKGVYIDSCAAPGNKTSQLAAYAKKVIAFERDPKRANTLAKMLKTAHLNNKVDVKVMDFTRFDPQPKSSEENEGEESNTDENDSEEYDGLIVDPSCSGSGIFRATTTTPERLEKLSEFQFLIMMHALRFNAKKVVYSTCSIHPEENEQVVKRLLEHPNVAGKWRLAPRERALPNWPRRGLTSEFPEANGCVRVNPRVDGGIGFFAACFERI